MAEKLKIIALGGLNEIGKNIYVYEFGGDMLVVDCGLGFPDDEMYGVDIVIPDFTYLLKNKNKVRALVLTHGHEDHIGSVPYLLRELNVPIYATPLTAGLVELKLAEHGLKENATINTLSAGESFKVGCFKVEFVHINHSIPGAVALAIKTPVGMLIHTGDFKIDTTPISGSMIDLARFGELGNKGIVALLADSTNVEKPGYSMSESKVGESFDDLFKGCMSRILVTTFASNVHRIQQVINCAAKYGRRVAVTGRSMENILRVSTELGCMEVPKGVLIELNQVKNLPNDKVVIMTTGSQGEAMSALYRMAFSDHRQVEIKPGDRVIISASAIPGNEKSVSRVIDELFRRGADVFYDKYSDIHVSGHAYQEELKMMMALTKPKYFIPLHGEYRMLYTHSKIAQQMGIEAKNIVVADIGQVIELTGRSIKKNGSVPSGNGTGVGDVGSVVLRDRKHLAQDGMLVVIVNVSSEDGSLVSGPDIITRGFIYVKESEEMMKELKDIVVSALNGCAANKITDFATLKSVVKQDLSNHLYKKTKRNPMILPVITEI
jgi:ribonuclease J